MADIEPTPQDGHLNRSGYKWDNVTESDEPQAARIEGGKYSCTVEGTMGGATIEFQYSKEGSTYHSLDSTNLSFTAAGTYNVEVGRGFIKPIRTGGSSASIDCFITPLPSESA